MAPTTTPTISQSSVCSSIMMVQCSGFLLHGRSSTRSSFGRWKHFSVMSVPILATTMSPSDAFGVRFTATMSPDWYPTADMLSPRTTT